MVLTLCILYWWCFYYRQLSKKLTSMVVITCNLHWWCFPYANLPMYWCAQAHMATHCNFHCVVVFVICGVGSSMCVYVCACVSSVFVVLVPCIVSLCMCLCMGQASNQEKREMKTTGQQGKKMTGVLIKSTPSCLGINCAKPCVMC